MEYDRKGPVSDEEIAKLANAERRRNISENSLQVSHNYHKRIGAIFGYLKSRKSLGNYHVVDFFYRVEF